MHYGEDISETWTSTWLIHAMAFIEERLRADLPLPEISVGTDDTFSEVRADERSVPILTQHVIIKAGGHRFSAGLRARATITSACPGVSLVGRPRR